MKHSQKGLSLYGLLLALAMMSVLVAYAVGQYADYHRQKVASQYASHLAQVAEQLQQYQYHKVTKEGIDPWMMTSWPDTWARFMTDYPGSFWLQCTDSEQSSGLCSRPDYVPWSTNKLGYKKEVPIPETSFAVITIPLSDLGVTTKSYRLWASPIQKLPNVKLLSNGDVELRVGRLQMATVYKDFLQKDGSTKLTDGWDVGGTHGIVNAGYVSVRNTNGSQRRLDAGVVGKLVGKHGQNITKHSCPIGLNPDLDVSVKSLQSFSSWNDFSTTGSFKPYKTDRGGYWTLGLDYYAKRKRDSRWIMMHDGYLDVDLICTR